jgi:hypothetical protein
MTTSGGSEDRDLRDRLRELRGDLPDEGFGAALHRRLVSAGAPHPLPFWRRLPRFRLGEPRLLWPAFGVAAGAAVFLALGQLDKGPLRPSSGVATELPATKVAVVRVNLTAEVAVESAHIRVSLPEGLVFWADGQELPQRAFEWTQPLQAGDNDIPIAVRGQRPGRYRLTVSARIGDQSVLDEVVLEVVEG